MVVNKNKAAHSAAGQYLGYALQPVRLCHYLLTAPEGATVSMEHADDVAVHYPDGRTLLEQCKSATSQNPVSDWAKDLWKAIANWLDSTKKDYPANADIQYRLFVRPAHTGSIAQAMSDAQTVEETTAVIQEIGEKLQTLPKKPACNKHLQKLLAAPEEEQHRFISRFTLETADEPLKEVKQKLLLTTPERAIDSICAWAIGRAKSLAEDLIVLKKPALIDATQFQALFRDFVRKNNLPAYLASFSQPPNKTQVNHLLSNRPTLIRQLELVNASDDDQLRSISDYLRSSADKTAWGASGYIFQHQLDDWNKSLTNRHSSIKSKIDLTQKQLTDEERGLLVFHECAQVSITLEGSAVPAHFVNGSFNDLANKMELGWHVNYKALLSKEDK